MWILAVLINFFFDFIVSYSLLQTVLWHFIYPEDQSTSSNDRTKELVDITVSDIAIDVESPQQLS
jgi:hypothetical protein